MGKATKRSSAKSNGKRSSGTSTRARKAKAAASNGDGHATATVTHDRIAQRAYEIWVAKGRPAGVDEQNWREAETELVAARA